MKEIGGDQKNYDAVLQLHYSTVATINLASYNDIQYFLALMQGSLL